MVQPGQGIRLHSTGHTGGKYVFVHISAVERAGLSALAERAKVSYEETARKVFGGEL